MAVGKEIKFGLNVTRSLADVVNNRDALKNIGIDINDLNVIRDAAGSLGVTADDIKSLSDLNYPLQEYLQRLYNDTQQYATIINQTAGTTETLKGNLTINGVLGAGAIKYRYIDDDNTTIKVADISTSRVSSWSSPENPSNALSPIFYGGEIEVDGKVLVEELELLEAADAVRFRSSEVPTHKIEATINGSTIYLYAMKGIPLIFEGFFRNLDSDLRIINKGAVSWRIVNVQTSYLTREYENVGGSSTNRSFLRYRDTRAAPKNVEIYHNPDNIRDLPLNALGIANLPSAQLSNLQRLYLLRNVIKTFPDFKTFCPNVILLDIRENPFHLGGDSNLRKFNPAVLDKIPTNVRELRMGNTFNGSITAQIRPSYDLDLNLVNIVIGEEYIITNNDDSFDFTTIGAANSNVGTIFTATATTTSILTSTVDIVKTTDNIRLYRDYEIVNSDDFDFTTLGAEDNLVGTTFRVTATTETAATLARVKDVTVGLPQLQRMLLNSHGRGGERNFFDRDGEDPTGSAPEVPDTTLVYNIYRNSFDTLPQSLKELPNLQSITLYSNGITDNNFFIDSEDINYVNMGGNTRINTPNMINKLKLSRFYSHYNRNVPDPDRNLFFTPEGAYKFSGCAALSLIYSYAGAYEGPIPKFAGNPNLYYVQARRTRLEGGVLVNGLEIRHGIEYKVFYNPSFPVDQVVVGQEYEISIEDPGTFDFTTIGAPASVPGVHFIATATTSSTDGLVISSLHSIGAASSERLSIFVADFGDPENPNPITNSIIKLIDREYVLGEGLFDDCADRMRYFQIASSSLINAPMHPNAFDKTVNMEGLWFRSFNRGVTGLLPNLSTMTRLRYIVVLQNKLEGPLPTLFNNPNVYYTHFYQNNFSGAIPNIVSTRLLYAYWHRNQLTEFNGLQCPNMRRLYISYNQIQGEFPFVGNMELVYDLYANNNQFTSYYKTSLVGCRSLRRFDISNNPGLTEGAVNDLIDDLLANYNNNPRSGVTVNLRNTSQPTGVAVEQIEFLRTSGWSIRT